MRRAAAGWLSVALVVAVAGCRPDGEAAASQETAAPAPAKPELKPLQTAQELKDIIAAERGKVVVVNFWATWCSPCVAEFPNLIQLRDTYRDRGLVLITVSGDFADTIDEKVLPFLEQHGVTDHCYLQDADDEDAFIKGFSDGWRGSLPATFIYDATGKQVELLTGEQTYEAFDAAVRPYLP